MDLIHINRTFFDWYLTLEILWPFISCIIMQLSITVTFLLTHYTLKSILIFSIVISIQYISIGTRRICLIFKASKGGNNFLYSHYLNKWFSKITIRKLRCWSLLGSEGWTKTDIPLKRNTKINISNNEMDTIHSPHMCSR